MNQGWQIWPFACRSFRKGSITLINPLILFGSTFLAVVNREMRGQDFINHQLSFFLTTANIFFRTNYRTWTTPRRWSVKVSVWISCRYVWSSAELLKSNTVCWPSGPGLRLKRTQPHTWNTDVAKWMKSKTFCTHLRKARTQLNNQDKIERLI